MSIRDIEGGRRRQKKALDARQRKEAKARPDALHRAVIFLLREIKQNNRDTAPEVDHHIATLDKELGEPELIAELEAPPAAAAAAPIAPEPETDEAPPEEQPAPPDTAAVLRQSTRFKRTS